MMTVIQPGVLSLLQDNGRFGQHRIGLTTGGPLDSEAFHWANRLCGNPPEASATAIEVSIGGLVLKAGVDTSIALAGANMPLKINQRSVASWQTLRIKAGDRIELGYATQGARAYLAVNGGFAVPPSFGSTATVVREGIGGLDGTALKKGDELPLGLQHHPECLMLPQQYRPNYSGQATLRVIMGYQQEHFSATQQALFFHSEYTVSEQVDRMGFRLEGQPVKANISSMLSEGICYGAIQIPADGQPIVLLNDRQTIGGYPKIGSVLSLDIARLTQLMPGAKVRFTPVSLAEAHNALHLSDRRIELTPLRPCEEL
ncbi:MAG: biotin-dependent carboxyltransferase family protein [Thiolinea sp.]